MEHRAGLVGKAEFRMHSFPGLPYLGWTTLGACLQGTWQRLCGYVQGVCPGPEPSCWPKPSTSSQLAPLKSCADTAGHLLPAQPAPTPFQGHLGPLQRTALLLPFGPDTWTDFLQFNPWHSLRVLAGTYLLDPPSPTHLWVDTLRHPCPWTSALALGLICWGPAWNAGA